MLSMYFYWKGGSGWVPANAMMYDDGIDLKNVYHLQIKPFARELSTSIAGQVLFDPTGDFLYTSYLAYVVNATF